MAENPYLVRFQNASFDSRDVIRLKRTREGSAQEIETMSVFSLQHRQPMSRNFRATTSIIGSFFYKMNQLSRNVELQERPLFISVDNSALYNAHHVDSIYYDQDAETVTFTLRGKTEETQSCKPDQFQKLRQTLELYDSNENLIRDDSSSKPSRFPDDPPPRSRGGLNDDNDDDDPERESLGRFSMFDGENSSGMELLKRHSIDFNAEAKGGRYNHLVVRATDIENVLTVLNEHTVKSVVLRGESGVGKTATVQGMVRSVVEGKVPPSMINAQVYSLNMTGMNSMWRGEFEGKMTRILDHVTKMNKKGRRTILFVDELHAQAQAGRAEGTPPVSELLKPYLTNGYVQVIGATTRTEYDEYILPNPALKRRFAPVDIDPPTPEELFSILKRSVTGVSRERGLIVPDTEIKQCIEMTNRFIHDSQQPAKGVDALSRACSIAEMKLEKTLNRDHLAEAVAKESGLKTGFVLKRDRDRILDIPQELPRRVLAQNQSTKPIATHLVSAFTGLQKRRGPLGKFLLVGPTGVGKTQTGRSLAEILSGDEDKLIRLDMSDYQSLRDMDNLVNELTSRVRQNPFSVIMLDEIEKADRMVLDRVLQLMEEGKLKDSKGRPVDFSNTVFLMSSNIGTDQFADDKVVGFGQNNEMSEAASHEHYRRAVTNWFAPEFLGRLDGVAYYNQLATEHMRQIITREIVAISSRTREQFGMDIAIDEQVHDALMTASDFRRYGARDMHKTIGKKIVEPLTVELLVNEDALRQQLADAAQVGRAWPIMFVRDVGENYSHELLFDHPELLPVEAPPAPARKIMASPASSPALH